MLLREAKEILENNGYILEGWKDDRAEWEKVKAKKYNGEKYRKWTETFNLGCGFTAQMIAAHPEPNPLYHQSAKIYIRYKNHEVASCWLHEQETLDDSNIIFIAVGTPMNDDTAATSMTLQSERKDLNCIKSVVKT